MLLHSGAETEKIGHEKKKHKSNKNNSNNVSMSFVNKNKTFKTNETRKKTMQIAMSVFLSSFGSPRDDESNLASSNVFLFDGLSHFHCWPAS